LRNYLTIGVGLDFLDCDGLRFTSEGIVFCEEKHAMTFFTLSHWNTRAIPKGLLHLSLLVFVVTAGTQSATQIILMAGQPLKHYCGHAKVAAEISAGALGIGFGKTPDHLETL